jgi:hypothetical protein
MIYLEGEKAQKCIPSFAEIQKYEKVYEKGPKTWQEVKLLG